MKEKSITQAIDNNHWSNRKMEEKKITESSTVKDVVEIVRDDLKKVLKMKENEPKVKDSQKWWDNYGYDDKDFKPTFKATYDKLVSLEARIELLNLFTKHYDDGERFLGFLEDHESELAELVKELKL